MEQASQTVIAVSNTRNSTASDDGTRPDSQRDRFRAEIKPVSMHEGFDPEGRRLPIKIDTTSNGELLPRPLSRLARAANREAQHYVGDCALRLGLSRRAFLKSVCGAAATLPYLNQVFARAGRSGGSFAIPPVAAFEPAAAEGGLGGSNFIFDIQAHHVNPHGAWRRLTNRWTYILRYISYTLCVFL